MTADEYIRSGSRLVKGWLAKESGLLVKVVSDAQAAAGTTGGVAERSGCTTAVSSSCSTF